jgi:hypothetical protein
MPHPPSGRAPGEVVEKHQLAGFDERERGFNRQVEIDRQDDRYAASFRYETTLVATDRQETQAAALAELVRLLQARGYRQLRSRVSFRGDAYLGSQEAWIEYPDQAWLTRVLQGFLRRFTRSSRT